MSNLTKSMRPLLRLQDAISLVGQWLGGLSLALIVVIYAYEVFVRYLMGAPTSWASDFVSFLLLISVFTVLPWLTREGGNVAVTLLPDYMPARGGRLLLRCGFVVAGIACLWVTYIGVQETLLLFQRNTMTLTTVRIPKWPLLALITFGLFNSGLYFFRLAARPNQTAQGGIHA